MPGFRGTLHEWKTGKLHSGSKKGPVVKSQAQALAIAFSEARKAGEDVPRKKKRRLIPGVGKGLTQAT